MLAQKAIEILPNIMSNFAQGYSTIGKMTIVGGSGDETNVATRMAGENAKAMSANFEIVKSATGVDLQSMLNSSLQGKALAEGLNHGRDVGVVPNSTYGSTPEQGSSTVETPNEDTSGE